ncbi:hypothetical protein Tco_1065830 [Tanacetum coccineum]
MGRPPKKHHQQSPPTTITTNNKIEGRKLPGHMLQLQLKKCHVDEPLVVPMDRLHIDDKLQFIEENIEIIDQEVKRLKPSCIPNCQGSLELSARS